MALDNQMELPDPYLYLSALHLCCLLLYQAQKLTTLRDRKIASPI